MSTTRTALFTLAALGLAAFVAHPASAQSTIYSFQVLSNSAGSALSYLGAGADPGATPGSFVSIVPGTNTPGVYQGTSGNITFSASGLSNYNTGSGGDGTAAQALLSQYLYSKDAGLDALDPGHFTASGFVPNSAYTLYLYGGDGAPQQQTSYTVNGVTQALTNAQNTTFVNGVNYDIFTGLTSANGTISGTFTTNDPNITPYGLLNGAQITGSAAPEPSQIGMLALAALGLGALAVKARRRTTAAQTA